MVTKGLALILSHNIKKFTNLWHFWESIYECSELVVRRYSKEKVQSWAQYPKTKTRKSWKFYKKAIMLKCENVVEMLFK